MSANNTPVATGSENDPAVNNNSVIEETLPQQNEVAVQKVTAEEVCNATQEVEDQLMEVIDPETNTSTDVVTSSEIKNITNDGNEDKPSSSITTEKVVDPVTNSVPNIGSVDVTNLDKTIDVNPSPESSNPINDKNKFPQSLTKGSVQLFTDDIGPQMYNAKGTLVTMPIITKNLPKVFEYLPVYGRPKDKKNLKEFFTNKIREFVGCDLSDFEFSQLQDYCNPEHLKTGKETVMGTNVPIMGVVSGNIIHNLNDEPDSEEAPDLCILKKNKMRNEKDNKGVFTKKLKYRGVRNLPFTQEVYQMLPMKPSKEVPDVDLEPGKDVLYRVRVYRPYTYNLAKDRFTRTRHSVFCCDIILTGRHKLSDLRDRFVCHNDFDMRVDVSNHPDMLPNTKAKEVFPSGFLFINNVFYVDTREGCIDYSEPIRAWAIKKNLGDFPRQDMCAVKLEDLVLKLGYPEVYVHQGNCEHVFLFSEVRLLNPTDPLRLYNYPCSTAIAQNQTVYCTTCAEFSAKWIVVGCSRVPFDPAFFCETCFRQYLYKDGEKIGEFKAYSYRGNALNVLKPQ